MQRQRCGRDPNVAVKCLFINKSVFTGELARTSQLAKRLGSTYVGPGQASLKLLKREVAKYSLGQGGYIQTC